MKQPNFLLSKPEPQIKQRLYNGRSLIVWEGKVKVSAVNGWVDNPRIELEKKKLREVVGDRELTQDEIFALMRDDPEVKLKELRDDIIRNGLREPLALSFTGKLLDGNRRFFAIKYALDKMPVTDPNRQGLESVDVYVLSEDATDEDEQNVLVEENFSASLKIEWPPYVKAVRVMRAYDNGVEPQEIARMFAWSKQKVQETIRIHEIIQEFLNYATAERNMDDEGGGGLGLSEQEAETVAAKNYQFFNEAQKSFFTPLKTDYDFKVQFFSWIHANKFSSFPEVRIAYKAWQDPQAKSVLCEPSPAAAKSAKAIIDYNARVVKGAEDAATRINGFVKFLAGLTASDLSKLPEDTRTNLRESLELVIRLSDAAAGE